jgi:hypothetical protein
MIRTRICLVILLIAPLAVYWQTVFHEYGLRDDYSHLREAREEPSKLVKFTASHGRPLYGALLETSYASLDGVSGLQLLRLTDVLLLTLLAIALWRQLFQSGWTEIEAAVIGLGVVLLPAAQISTGWAINWPQILALLLAMAGFSAIETELERGGLKRAVALLGGVMIYAIAALIYQSNALFAVALIAAVYLVRSGRDRMPDTTWLLFHVAALLAGLAISFYLVQMLYSAGVFQESSRLLFETNPFTKTGWFFWQPLPNALALYALRDDFNTGAFLFWVAALAVAGVIGFAYRTVAHRADPLIRKRWLLCLLALPLVAHSVSLLASERSTGYRVLFALSSLVLVLLVFSLRSLNLAGRLKLYFYYLALGLISLAGIFTATRNAWRLLAEPQGLEWEMVLTPVMRATFKGPTKVYIITPTIQDRSTDRIFSDEFGSLSSDSDWVAREMFHAAIRERYQGKQPKGFSYTVTLGRTEPEPKTYNLVIDMRKLGKLRGL